MTSITDVKKEISAAADQKQAKVLQRFFKTGKGEYGEGDIFLGIKVPAQREIAKKHKELSAEDAEKLLTSSIHEHRLVALLILIMKYEKENAAGRKKIFDIYLRNTRNINNWDLVDLSAPNIAGSYLSDKPRKPLYKLARSKLLWEKRIAIVATHYFIRKNEFQDTLRIAESLLNDKHDLIHKAVGWMLREVGKRDQDAEERFLKKHYRQMPRTMLRYSIEKFSKAKKEFYMKKGSVRKVFLPSVSLIRN